MDSCSLTFFNQFKQSRCQDLDQKQSQIFQLINIDSQYFTQQDNYYTFVKRKVNGLKDDDNMSVEQIISKLDENLSIIKKDQQIFGNSISAVLKQNDKPNSCYEDFLQDQQLNFEYVDQDKFNKQQLSFAYQTNENDINLMQKILGLFPRKKNYKFPQQQISLLSLQLKNTINSDQIQEKKKQIQYKIVICFFGFPVFREMNIQSCETVFDIKTKAINLLQEESALKKELCQKYNCLLSQNVDSADIELRFVEDDVDFSPDMDLEPLENERIFLSYGISNCVITKLQGFKSPKPLKNENEKQKIPDKINSQYIKIEIEEKQISTRIKLKQNAKLSEILKKLKKKFLIAPQKYKVYYKKLINDEECKLEINENQLVRELQIKELFVEKKIFQDEKVEHKKHLYPPSSNNIQEQKNNTDEQFPIINMIHANLIEEFRVIKLNSNALTKKRIMVIDQYNLKFRLETKISYFNSFFILKCMISSMLKKLSNIKRSILDIQNIVKIELIQNKIITITLMFPKENMKIKNYQFKTKNSDVAKYICSKIMYFMYLIFFFVKQINNIQELKQAKQLGYQLNNYYQSINLLYAQF